MKRNDRNGAALIYAMLLALFVVPMLLILARDAAMQLRHSHQEKEILSARALSRNALTDYMRQFSQRSRFDLWDTDQFDRPQAFYESGFTDVQFQIPQPQLGTLFIRATGNFRGAKGSLLGTRQTMESVVRFVNDTSRFVFFANRPMLYRGSGVTESGSVFVGGWLDVDTTGMNRFSGDLVVGGSVTFHNNNVWVDGDLYYTGALSMPSDRVAGGEFNVSPRMESPTIDIDFFRLMCAWSTNTVVSTWTFRDADAPGDTSGLNGGYVEILTDGVTTLQDYPDASAILLAEDSAITIQGELRGRVTIVVTGQYPPLTWTPGTYYLPIPHGAIPAPPPPVGVGYVGAQTPLGRGTVHINGNMTYAHPAAASGRTYADSRDSLGILYTQLIIFHGPNLVNELDAIYACDEEPGAFFRMCNLVTGGATHWDGIEPCTMVEVSTRSNAENPWFHHVGTRVNSSFLNVPGGWPFSSNMGQFIHQRSFIWDPNLSLFPPPGLPVRAKLITHRVKAKH